MKLSEIDIEIDKNLKKINFQRFHAFFPCFQQTLQIGTLKRVNKGRMCCPLGFPEEFIAVFSVTMFYSHRK